SISLPQLSQTSTVLRATIRPPFRERSEKSSRDAIAILSSFARSAYSPRTQQADKRLFFEIKSRLTCPDDAQISRPEIVERSPVEILLDDGRADVGRTRNGGATTVASRGGLALR